MSGVQRMSTYHTFGLTARSLSTYLSGESKGVPAGKEERIHVF